MKTRTFLLEVGCEEIPAGMLPAALDDLGARLVASLGSLGGRVESPAPFGGPRRLVALVTDILDREEDRIEIVKGPSVGVAYDREGNPTRAAIGFARGQGVAVESLERVKADKGEVVTARRSVVGRRAVEVLAGACPAILSAMRFPKMMKWGDRGYAFVRPVHWIVALLDDEVVPFEFVGVSSGRVTAGHRFLAPGPHEVPRAQDYEKTLEARGRVTVRNAERRARIASEAARVAAAMGWVPGEDEALLSELTHLTEHPGVIAGRFPEKYLDLEEPFVVTPMKHHQKYFPVYSTGGGLAPGFLAVVNLDTDVKETVDAIRRGNEWVLGARLADARFFRVEDAKRSLLQRDEALSRIAFHEKLGNMLQRSERLERLAEFIASELELDGETRRVAARAARLSKADLTTGMVGEFPELQGLTGGIYLRSEPIEGAETIARAVGLQYMQAPPAVSPPETAGMIVALADKLDLLVGCFSVGLIPKGSADPYGLRRAALGACRILTDEFGLGGGLSIFKALERSRGFFDEQGILDADGEWSEPLIDFVGQRLRFLMEESGIRYDTARAVLATEWAHDLRAAWLRAEHLDAIRNTEGPDFDSLAASAKRIRNILAQASRLGVPLDGGDVIEERLVDPDEKDLSAGVRTVARKVEERIGDGDYRAALRAIASLRPSVDRFFDNVMVMAEDQSLRKNRLSLLRNLFGLLSRVADFSHIVVEGEGTEGK